MFGRPALLTLYIAISRLKFGLLQRSLQYKLIEVAVAGSVKVNFVPLQSVFCTIHIVLPTAVYPKEDPGVGVGVGVGTGVEVGVGVSVGVGMGVGVGV